MELFNFSFFSISGWGIDWITVILNGLPWKWTEIILSFLRLHPRTALQILVDYEGYSISSKGYLPIVVDTMVIWVKFAHFSPFYWFLKCWCSLAISCLTTSNLNWLMDLTFQVPMQYCSLQLRTLLTSPGTSTTGYFALAPSLHSVWSFSPLISSSILVTYWSEEFIVQCPMAKVHATDF